MRDIEQVVVTTASINFSGAIIRIIKMIMEKKGACYIRNDARYIVSYFRDVYTQPNAWRYGS